MKKWSLCPLLTQFLKACLLKILRAHDNAKLAIRIEVRELMELLLAGQEIEKLAALGGKVSLTFGHEGRATDHSRFVGTLPRARPDRLRDRPADRRWPTRTCGRRRFLIARRS